MASCLIGLGVCDRPLAVLVPLNCLTGHIMKTTIATKGKMAHDANARASGDLNSTQSKLECS